MEAPAPPPSNTTPQLVLAAQIKQPHFWISLVSFVAHVLIASRALPPGYVLQIVAALSASLHAIGYQAGALWQPPRKIWTDEERHAAFASELRTAGWTVTKGAA